MYQINSNSNGVVYPQDEEYMDTTKVMIEHRSSLGKKSHQSIFLRWCVKFASLFIGSFKKMYSSKIYLIDNEKGQ